LSVYLGVLRALRGKDAVVLRSCIVGINQGSDVAKMIRGNDLTGVESKIDLEMMSVKHMCTTRSDR
jgi:hypothetical protein